MVHFDSTPGLVTTVWRVIWRGRSRGRGTPIVWERVK